VKPCTVTALLLCLMLLLVAHGVRAEATSADDAAARCQALASTDFTQVLDAPTQVAEASVVEAHGDNPAYCRVQGYVWPQVGFELRLPLSRWNGKFFEAGCGGACGNTGWMFLCPLYRGYACIASDMGHQGTGQDLSWAYQELQAQIDFDIRGPHVVALAGKAITERFYAKPPTRAYFMGCSTGGRQALGEAQRFPWDFDGIIGLAGAPSFSAVNMEYIWGERALRAKDGRSLLTRQDLELVHDAALARCDLDDGVKDGIIGDPYHCKFDPSELLCKPGATKACLTAEQVEAVKKIYAGPTTSSGEKKPYIRGLAPGSEMGWIDDNGMEFVKSGTELGGLEDWSLNVFRYLAFVPPAGPGWQLKDFDFDRDYKRLGVVETLMGAFNPDLRRFKDAGGKLIYAYGLNDQNSDPAAVIDYYETAERVTGSRAQTLGFFRLFMVPGMAHCTSGDGAFAIDYVSYLEDWVERNRAPDKLLGAHVDRQYLEQHTEVDGKPTDAWTAALALHFPLNPNIPVMFTRPIFPFPTLAKYKGTGDPKDAANFGPVPAPREEK
jgi:hypothetical protein